MSNVTFNLVALAGVDGTQTRARGRENLHWRTLGTPEVEDRDQRQKHLGHRVVNAVQTGSSSSSKSSSRQESRQPNKQRGVFIWCDIPLQVSVFNWKFKAPAINQFIRLIS